MKVALAHTPDELNTSSIWSFSWALTSVDGPTLDDEDDDEDDEEEEQVEDHSGASLWWFCDYYRKKERIIKPAFHSGYMKRENRTL